MQKDVLIFSVDEDPQARTDAAELNTIWIGAGPQATYRVMKQIYDAIAAGESEIVIHGEGPDSYKTAKIDLRRLRDKGFILTDVDGTIFRSSLLNLSQ